MKALWSTESLSEPRDFLKRAPESQQKLWEGERTGTSCY